MNGAITYCRAIIDGIQYGTIVSVNEKQETGQKYCS